MGSCAIADSSDIQEKLKANASGEQFASVCNQPYAICNTAFCVPEVNNPTKMRCSCSVENGSSVGGPCSEWEPVGISMNEDGEWMIKAGYAVGQVFSTYSFVHAAPVEGNEIDPDNIPADYTGDVYLKGCTNATGDGMYADCWNAPCSVLPQDINADITQDRPAAPYAVCDCGIALNQSEWFIAVHGDEKCEDKTLCNDYIISGASIKNTVPGVLMLNKALKENPDPTEPYKEGYCKDCADCNFTAKAE
jgi:hypothetical protein